MAFKKRPINRSSRTWRTYKKRAYKKKSSNFARTIKKFILFLLFSFIIISSITWIVLYQKYIKPLPSVKDLWNLKIAESSTIYDKEKNPLYKIYKENRTYINYEEINKNMVNAIVAWEDKRFFVNPWVDLMWITRALIYFAIWKTSKIEWTSTISQQLIRNTVITNERKIERKIKEIYLSYKMTQWLSKQKILELYLNKISFWANAYWIEQASKNLFNKQAKDLWVLEASILASLPKGPSYYSPYNHPDRLLWHPFTYNKSDSKNTTKIITKKDAILAKDILPSLELYIENLKLKRISDSKALVCWLEKDKFKNDLKIDKDWCSVIDYSDLLSLLNSIKIEKDETVIEYQTWRKDFILGRMLEDKYITFDQYKEALLNSFAYNFEHYRENIKYPHFVFYIREYLEEKYWKELVENWWLKIYTSIDPKLQDKAEELIEKYSKINIDKYDAHNAALISINNETWEILSMVWWRDYFDKENKWNVNVVTSRLQPWSTFKPFVYSIAINNNPIWTKTPVYDLETSFPWKYTPANFDWKFEWKLTLSKALNHSRNIPAIKMFFMAWWEDIIINFMERLWVKSLRAFKEEYLEKYNKNYTYWASMALWTWLMTPLELAQAYSVYANMWKKVELTPIIKILDSKGLVIEEKITSEEETEDMISPALAYITNSILTNTSARPEFWNTYLTLKWRPVAAKTWTSTKQYTKGWKKYIFPRNLWTIWYTPQITTVVWAWNTDWRELNYKWNWLEWAWPIWRDFMEFAHKWKNVKKWTQPKWVKNVNISTVSGLLPSESLNNSFITSSMFINGPINYDDSFKSVEVDALCNWKVTDSTPEAAIKSVKLLKLHSLKPTNASWETPVKKWINSAWFKKEYWNIQNIISDVSDETCERSLKESKIEIWSTIEAWDVFVNGPNYIEVAYRSNNPILRFDIFLWENKIWDIKLGNKLKWIYRWTFSIPVWYYWEYSLKIRAVDSQYYSNEEIKYIEITKKDIIPPEVNITNPSNWKIKLYKWDFFNLRWEVKERTWIRSINIYIDGKPLKIWLTTRNFVYSINSENLSLWDHIIKIEAIDTNFSVWKKEINLEIIKN